MHDLPYMRPEELADDGGSTVACMTLICDAVKRVRFDFDVLQKRFSHQRITGVQFDQSESRLRCASACWL